MGGMEDGNMSSTKGFRPGYITETPAQRAYRNVLAAIVAVGNVGDHVHRKASLYGVEDYQLAYLEEKVRNELSAAKRELEEVLTHGENN